MSKRLLFITPIFPKNIDEDSVVPFISQFTQAFAETTDVHIEVISLMYPFSSKKYSIGEINVYPIGSKFVPFIKQIPFLIKAIFKGKSLFKQNKYDGILCFWYRESALIGWLLSYFLNVKLVVWLLGQDINANNKYIKLLKIPKNQLVLMSRQQSDLFFEYQKIKIDKIANVAITRNLFPELNTNERKIDILGVGNLGALKNYSLFIEIISLLKDKKCNAIIIGDGEEMEMLKSKTQQLGLSNNIEFIGSKSHNEVLDYMNNAKIFLHTSKSEGGGTVLQEALYSGCKLVSTIDIESYTDEESFYFSLEKLKLIERIDALLPRNLIAKRIENFKMEDTIKVIYDSFYKD
jgi:glycosyltransferase involved in cell wall biosynthesis